MMLTQIAPPAALPVTLAELRAHLRLSDGFPEDTAEDALLLTYLETATAQIEARTGQALVGRPCTLRVGQWSASGHLVLPLGPVEAIDAFAWVGGAPGPDVPPGELVVEPGRTRQRVTGPGGGALPPIPAGNSAELGFTAGRASPAEIPADLRQAVLMLAAHRFEIRDGAEAPGLPAAVAALVAPHRPVRL